MKNMLFIGIISAFVLSIGVVVFFSAKKEDTRVNSINTQSNYSSYKY